MSMLGAQRTARTILSMPEYGTARADVLLENGTAPALGPATLAVAGLTMTGAIVTADLDAPDLPHAVWQNGVGWDTPLGARAYYTPNGILLATVLRDLAADTGETFAVDPRAAFGQTMVGTAYTRIGSTPAVPQTGRMALEALRRAGYVAAWWVDASGATNFGARPSGPATGRVDIMRRRANVGLRVFGFDDASAFLPGTTLEGVTTRRLVVREAGSALVGEAWA